MFERESAIEHSVTAIFTIIRFIFEETDKCFELCIMDKRETYRSWGKGYFHFCTDGLSGRDIFTDASEYASGNILLGLISVKFDIKIYAYSLMPNHIHLALSGTGADCVQAFDYLKRKLSAMMKRSGREPLPEDYGFNLEPVDTPDKMKTEIIYILRNALEKGLGMVGSYLWDSGWMYYSKGWSALLCCNFKLSQRELTRRIGGVEEIPESWQFHPYLGLNPYSFVDTSLVHQLFPSPKDLQTALVKDFEVQFQIARRLGELTSFNKAEMEYILTQILDKRFDGRSLKMLSDDEKAKLAIILHRELGLNSFQISTTIYIKEIVIRQLLSSKALR